MMELINFSSVDLLHINQLLTLLNCIFSTKNTARHRHTDLVDGTFQMPVQSTQHIALNQYDD